MAKKKPKPPKLHPQSEDWHRWAETNEAQRSMEGITQGEYLRNRINRAFAAGWDAAAKRYKPESEAPNDRD